MLWNMPQKNLLPHNERDDDKLDILAEPGPQYVESQKDNIISYLLVCIWEKCKGKGGGGDDDDGDDDGGDDDDDDDVMRKYSFILKDVPFGSSKISSYCMHLGARQRDSYSNQVSSIKFHKGMLCSWVYQIKDIPTQKSSCYVLSYWRIMSEKVMQY